VRWSRIIKTAHQILQAGEQDDGQLSNGAAPPCLEFFDSIPFCRAAGFAGLSVLMFLAKHDWCFVLRDIMKTKDLLLYGVVAW
jgi:hypothetical protein